MVPESNIEIQNQSGSKTNLDRSNLSDLKNTTDTMQVKMSQDPWILGLQFAISGSAAGLALFFGSLGLDRYRRPILKLAEEYTRDPVSIDLDIYKSINPQYDLELRRFQVKYWVNRIPITWLETEFGTKVNVGNNKSRG